MRPIITFLVWTVGYDKAQYKAVAEWLDTHTPWQMRMTGTIRRNDVERGVDGGTDPGALQVIQTSCLRIFHGQRNML